VLYTSGLQGDDLDRGWPTQVPHFRRGRAPSVRMYALYRGPLTNGLTNAVTKEIHQINSSFSSPGMQSIPQLGFSVTVRLISAPAIV
jgi:hypothetical protein